MIYTGQQCCIGSSRTALKTLLLALSSIQTTYLNMLRLCSANMLAPMPIKQLGVTGTVLNARHLKAPHLVVAAQIAYRQH